jgi:hypothetical protein
LKKFGVPLDTEKMRRIAFSNYTNDLVKNIVENVNGSQKTIKFPFWRGSDGFTLRSKIESINSKFSKELLGTKLASMATIHVGSNVLISIEGVQYKGMVYRILKIGEDTMYCIDPAFASDTEHFFQKGTGFYMGDCSPDQHFVDKSGKCRILRSASDPSRTVYSGQKILWIKDDYVDFESTNVAIDHSTWLLDYIQKNKTRDLTIFPSTSIFNEIVRDFVSNNWVTLTKQLVDETAQIIGEFVHWVVHESVPESLPRLRQFLLKQLLSILKTLTEDCRHECRNLLSKEEEPYTQNHYLSENLMKERMASIKKLLKGDDIYFDILISIRIHWH